MTQNLATAISVSTKGRIIDFEKKGDKNKILIFHY